MADAARGAGVSGERAEVAVVIPNWNSRGYLARCLESLAEQDVAFELLVIDNGSSDGSVEWMRKQGIPHVALPTNSGFAPAVNLGAARTTAPAVFALNADTRLEPGCLRRLLEALGERPDLGGVQPCILQEEADGPHRIYSAGQSLTRDGRGYEFDAGELRRSARYERSEIFGVCGAACLLRRELFSQLGGYDERYFAFCEDVDLNVRARIMGWRFELVPDAITWHVGNAVWQQGFTTPRAENARLVARNRLATQIKFMPARAIPLILAVEAGALLRALRQRRFLATLRGKLEAIGWLKALLGERRLLSKTGKPEAARIWLGRGIRPASRDSLHA